MKTKNIFKALALAMLMPAMLLTIACSNEDDVVNNTENIANKGYELPVTVNVTRQDAAATRATFDGSKLNFGEGDKLFVKGNDSSAGGAGFFAGTLTWQSGGTFSGTILTENAYSGTIDALFTAGSALATLLPANYGDYPYLSFTNKDTYSASVNYDATKTFATSKATAVEQFSFEVGGYTSGTGFALHPSNAILNFTITGLAASTEFAVAFKDNTDFTISGNVTTNVSGTATFAIGVNVGTDLKNWTLKVGTLTIPLVNSSMEVAAGKIYNINRLAPNGPRFKVSDTKQVYFSKGNLQATYNGSSWTWAFAANQWDYVGNAAGNTSINGNGTVSANNVTVDLFGWVGASSNWTGAAQYGISNSTVTNNVDGYGNVASEALKADWGTTMGTGWRTLTIDEWTYLLNTRVTGALVNSTSNARYTYAVINTDGTEVKGLIIFPDGYVGETPTGVTWGTINAKSAFTTTCTSAGWLALNAAGCIFLPAAGYREGSTVTDAGVGAGYWSSSSPSNATYAHTMYFDSDYMRFYATNRKYGFCVRLVQDVE